MLIKNEAMRKRVIHRLELYIVKTQSCWLWEGATDEFGNPFFDGEPVRRLLYELTTGNVVMPNRFVMPYCRNRDCVLPDHARIVNGTDALEWYNNPPPPIEIV